MQLIDDELFGFCPTETTPEGITPKKASLFTLIVAVKDMARRMHCQRLVHRIVEKLPCKIIFIAIDSEAKEEFLRQNTFSRTLRSGPQPVCCDIMTIQTSPNLTHQIPFLILPEIIPDLPVFLLIGHEPWEIAPLVNELLPYVDRIIFDVQRFSNIGHFADQHKQLPQKHTFIDLNWARTKPWREGFLRVFNTQDRLHQLFTSHTINIRFSQRPSLTTNLFYDSQALLFQAWIASRFNWQPVEFKEEADHIHIRYRSNDHQITVTLSPADSAFIEEGNIISVECRGENETHFLLSYETDDRHIAVHASSKDQCEMPYTLFVGSFQRGRALPNEIFQQTASAHYLPLVELLTHEMWQKNRS